jgi:hypothetical protein
MVNANRMETTPARGNGVRMDDGRLERSAFRASNRILC